MIIVKKFQDQEFLSRLYHWRTDHDLCDESFYWGLGDDGQLYCYCSLFVRYSNSEGWILPNRCVLDVVDLKVMVKIVSKFGYLVPFV